MKEPWKQAQNQIGLAGWKQKTIWNSCGCDHIDEVRWQECLGGLERFQARNSAKHRAKDFVPGHSEPFAACLSVIGSDLSRTTLCRDNRWETSFLAWSPAPLPKVVVSLEVKHRSPTSAEIPSVTFLGPMTFLDLKRNCISCILYICSVIVIYLYQPTSLVWVSSF